MIRKLTLAAGFGAGYVLGAKAGTERYDQIQTQLRKLAGRPAVQDVKNNLTDTASAIGDTAKDKLNDVVDLAATSKPKTEGSTPPSASTAAAPQRPLSTPAYGGASTDQ